MRITVGQLRRIIKEEVSKVTQGVPLGSGRYQFDDGKGAAKAADRSVAMGSGARFDPDAQMCKDMGVEPSDQNLGICQALSKLEASGSPEYEDWVAELTGNPSAWTAGTARDIYASEKDYKRNISR